MDERGSRAAYEEQEWSGADEGPGQPLEVILGESGQGRRRREGPGTVLRVIHYTRESQFSGEGDPGPGGTGFVSDEL